MSYVSQLTPRHIKELSSREGIGMGLGQSEAPIATAIEEINQIKRTLRGGKMIYVRANNSDIKVANTLIIINHNKAGRQAAHTHIVGVVGAAFKPHAGP